MESISRRELCVGLGALAATSIGVPKTVMAADPPASQAPFNQIIDCHTHFYDPFRKEGVPWPNQGDTLLFRPVYPVHFKAVAEPHRVVGTIVIEASPWVPDNDWVLELVAKDPFLKGLVGNLPVGTPEFRTELDRLSKNPRFLGIRVTGEPLKRGLNEPAFIEDIKRLADKGLELDVNGPPTTLQHIHELGQKVPSLRIVVNHMAGCPTSPAGVNEAWKSGINLVAKNPKIFMKISALVYWARIGLGGKRPMEGPAFYKPYFDVAFNAFGEDRLIYGSDWPVCEMATDYGTAQKVIEDYVTMNYPKAVAKVFRENSKAAYRWPE